MRELTAEASGIAPQPIEVAFTQLRDLESYPVWYPTGAQSVDVLERDEQGAAREVDVVLSVAAGPLRRSFRMRMAVRAQDPTLVAVERIADARGDHERCTIMWRLHELDEARTEISVELAARLELPPFLPIRQISRDVVQGFLNAALTQLA